MKLCRRRYHIQYTSVCVCMRAYARERACLWLFITIHDANLTNIFFWTSYGRHEQDRQFNMSRIKTMQLFLAAPKAGSQLQRVFSYSVREHQNLSKPWRCTTQLFCRLTNNTNTHTGTELFYSYVLTFLKEQNAALRDIISESAMRKTRAKYTKILSHVQRRTVPSRQNSRSFSSPVATANQRQICICSCSWSRALDCRDHLTLLKFAEHTILH